VDDIEKRGKIKICLIDILRTVSPDADLPSINDNKRLRDQLDIDSMDFLDIVMELRKRYGIEVPKEDYQKLATINNAIDYLLPRATTMYK